LLPSPAAAGAVAQLARASGWQPEGRGFESPQLHSQRRSVRARSYEQLDTVDLERLGRVADAELDAFFARNPHLAGWRERVRVVALAQGAAEHYLRGQRGVWDLDVIVCFAADPALPRLWRRMVVSWDWGPSKLGRCPHDPAEYSGRAVDFAFWVIPDRRDAVAGLQEWLAERAAKYTDPERKPDLAQEPVVLIHPSLGLVAWDPPNVPRAKAAKRRGHRRPRGLAPP